MNCIKEYYEFKLLEERWMSMLLKRRKEKYRRYSLVNQHLEPRKSYQKPHDPNPENELSLNFEANKNSIIEKKEDLKDEVFRYRELLEVWKPI